MEQISAFKKNYVLPAYDAALLTTRRIATPFNLLLLSGGAAVITQLSGGLANPISWLGLGALAVGVTTVSLPTRERLPANVVTQGLMGMHLAGLYLQGNELALPGALISALAGVRALMLMGFLNDKLAKTVTAVGAVAAAAFVYAKGVYPEAFANVWHNPSLILKFPSRPETFIKALPFVTLAMGALADTEKRLNKSRAFNATSGASQLVYHALGSGSVFGVVICGLSLLRLGHDMVFKAKPTPATPS